MADEAAAATRSIEKAVLALPIALLAILAYRFRWPSTTTAPMPCVWSFIFDALGDRWLHGFGFASFWDDPATQQAYIAYSHRSWLASSHSTFVDTLAWLGIVGLVLVLIVVVAGLAALCSYAITRGGWESTWWCGLGEFAPRREHRGIHVAAAVDVLGTAVGFGLRCGQAVGRSSSAR
jgi:O-antigen ligase